VVIRGSVWRRMRCTAKVSTPALSKRLAVVCRRSWNRRCLGIAQNLSRPGGKRDVQDGAPSRMAHRAGAAFVEHGRGENGGILARAPPLTVSEPVSFSVKSVAELNAPLSRWQVDKASQTIGG
jgi:hypothetical protein